MSAINNIRTRQSESLKKRDHIVYDKSWPLRLSHLMGVYSRYSDSDEQHKSLKELNKAIKWVQEDTQNRLFYNKNKEELDYNAMVAFDELAQEFQMLLGTKNFDRKSLESNIIDVERQLNLLEVSLRRKWDPVAAEKIDELRQELDKLSKQNKYNLSELRAMDLPDPRDDNVYIGREVPIVLAWGDRPAAYVAFRIGFTYEIIVPKQMGSMIIPMPEKVPMLDWSDPNIIFYKSNCIPYAYWVRERTAILNEIMDIVFKLERIMAQFLHNEGFMEFNAKKRQPVNSDGEWSGREPVDESDKYNL